MPVMKEGRMPLSQLVKNDKKEEEFLSKLTASMNDMLAIHDRPEYVVKILNDHIKNWSSEWRKQGVGKGKRSFKEFMNSGIVGFDPRMHPGLGGFNPHRKSALLNVKRRRQAKIVAPGSS